MDDTFIERMRVLDELEERTERTLRHIVDERIPRAVTELNELRADLAAKTDRLARLRREIDGMCVCACVCV